MRQGMVEPAQRLRLLTAVMDLSTQFDRRPVVLGGGP
jgi:hypothetical protein